MYVVINQRYGDKMGHKENDFRKICFYCGSIYEKVDIEILTCPVCGKNICLSKYEKVMKNIRQAVFGGWTWCIEYEDEDKLTFWKK